jgi:hypothetical protein
MHARHKQKTTDHVARIQGNPNRMTALQNIDSVPHLAVNVI